MLRCIDRFLLKAFSFWGSISSAARRVEFPSQAVDRKLVLDVGGGGLPSPYSHVIVEAEPDDRERATPLRKTKAFVWGRAEKLPFREKVFSYSILSHVLEHLEDPVSALKELQRVSQAGYIETPNSLYEYTIPHTYHLSCVDNVDGKLRITFKKRWDQSFEDVALVKAARVAFETLIRLRPNVLLTRFEWRNSFEFEVLGNPFLKDEKLIAEHSSISPRSKLREVIVNCVYRVINPKLTIPLEELLACPQCKSNLEFTSTVARCVHCHSKYGKLDGHWDFRL
jgi:SAM-dependent methyltransferase